MYSPGPLQTFMFQIENQYCPAFLVSLKQFLKSNFLQGFVEFRYNLGSGPAILRSLRKVTWSTLHIYSYIIRIFWQNLKSKWGERRDSVSVEYFSGQIHYVALFWIGFVFSIYLSFSKYDQRSNYFWMVICLSTGQGEAINYHHHRNHHRHHHQYCYCGFSLSRG